MTTLVIDESSLRSLRVQVTKETLVVDLVDSRSISVPLVWYPRLVQASVEERQQSRLIGSVEDRKKRGLALPPGAASLC
jgi:hypothetical protein